ncbi:uncharacterized protein LOC117325572 [Pecten maximus]|uniref:uncharacterized protein LOC117325572 n=1 Tax=Pecten maximus TaxID=6579 RepID=UPI00145889E7|nr:uncharacterized protein LOC117325572 [Pecten maximus]XP_033737790.1 uncharacterized protein LOC117325572 [Pecten maximus]XP_033737791.1 uncharacterized protein LOC117325572 [Pecten maximus]
MPAVPANVSDCVQALLEQLLSQQTPSPCSANSTSAPSERSESRALLYIVVTLLFYSGGIIIGIITYLKRERREIEEDREFDEFINTYIEPETRTTFHKVQQVIARLKYLQEEKIRKMGSKGTDVKSNDNEDKKDNVDKKECVENSLIKTANSWNETETSRLDNTICEDDEPLSSIVAKLIDPDKRRSFDEDSDMDEDYHEGGLTKTSSMQSIKDYTEEPGRSARSSLIDDDNEMVDDDSSTLISNQRLGNKEGIQHCKTVNKGCIVTNV